MRADGAMTDAATGKGSKGDPWQLQTASQTSSYEMYRDESADAWDAIRVIRWWVVRAEEGPTRSFRGLPAALLEALGLVELEHNPRNNRVRARQP